MYSPSEPDKVARCVELHAPPRRAAASMDNVMAFDAQQHEIVPAIGNHIIMDIVRRQWLLVMDNPFLRPSVPMRRLVMTSLADIHPGFCICLCTFAPTLTIVKSPAKLTSHSILLLFSVSPHPDCRFRIPHFPGSPVFYSPYGNTIPSDCRAKRLPD